MPFIGPLKGACPSLCPQKARRHSLFLATKRLFAFLSNFKFACNFTEQKRLEEYLLFLNFEVAYGLL